MEKLSPQLLGEDKEIWMEFIKRDIPQWDQYDLPEKSKNWYEIYSDLREDVQRALDADAEKMKMALDGLQSQKQRLTPKIISGPRTKGGQWSKSTFGSRFGASRSSSISVSKKKQTPFTPQRRNNALAVPTKHLHTRQSQVQRAPRSLVEIHRRPEPIATAPKRAERPPQLPVPPGSSSSSLAEREARLRAIAAGQQPPPLSNPEPPRKRPLPSSSRSSPPADSGGPSDRMLQASTRPPAQQTPAPSPARPVMPRKRPDSVFIQPKRRRLV